MNKTPEPREPRRAVQIEVRWGNDVLTVKHFDPPRDVFVGEAGFEVHRAGDTVGKHRIPLVSVDDGVVSVVYAKGTTGRRRVDGSWGTVAASTVPLQEGECAEVSLGDVTFAVSLVRLDAPKRSWIRSRTAVAALTMAASSAAFVALIAASRPVGGNSLGQGVTDEQFVLMQYYLAAAAERELESMEADGLSKGQPTEGGSGARAKGEEGGMGHPRRYGVGGPKIDPSHSADPRDSAQFGMIGLLNTGAGGDPNAPTSLGGRGEAIGLGSIGTIGHGAGTGGGFGSGHWRLAGSHHAGGNARSSGVPETSAPTPEAPIDPNGRFATTYRPGKGHLSAFESAIARGAIPAASREMVSDIGSRYAPDFAVEPGNALGFRADLERSKLSPSGGPFHLRFAIRSAQEANAARPHLSVHLVLDVSGSMQGEPLERAKQAAQHLTNKLQPQDSFSLVTFSSEGKVQVPSGPVGPRRSAIRQTIDRMAVEGGTNIGAGLQLAYQQARSPALPEDAIRVVLLVSDGQANEGITDRSTLSSFALEAFQSGIQTSTFGVGASYDGQLMSDVASDGAGGYYYLQDASGIGPALSMELDQRLAPVATAVEVRVRLRDDVALLRVYGSRRLTDVESVRVRAVEVAADQQAEKRDQIKANRQSDLEGGMRFFIPAFATNDRCSILMQLRAPAGVSDRSVALVEVKYKDRIGMRNVTHEVPISVGYANSAEESARTEDSSVVRTVQGYLAGESLIAAAGALSGGDRVRATSLLEEREQILRMAAGQLGEPAFVQDAARLGRLRAQMGGGAALEPLALATLLEAAGRNHFQ
jgi:Ca-activated chloride channel family protein